VLLQLKRREGSDATYPTQTKPECGGCVLLQPYNSHWVRKQQICEEEVGTKRAISSHPSIIFSVDDTARFGTDCNHFLNIVEAE
jgi:hypothetical protein